MNSVELDIVYMYIRTQKKKIDSFMYSWTPYSTAHSFKRHVKKAFEQGT